jgi:hypothetical protein
MSHRRQSRAAGLSSGPYAGEVGPDPAMGGAGLGPEGAGARAGVPRGQRATRVHLLQP